MTEILIRQNNEDECYDLIDVHSDQSHDGDIAREIIAKVYEYPNAVKIAAFLQSSKD